MTSNIQKCIEKPIKAKIFSNTTVSIEEKCATTRFGLFQGPHQVAYTTMHTFFNEIQN